jgi:hypothetical protein
MLKSIQDLGFQRISPHRQQIVTRSLVSGGRASIVGSVDFREPTTAGPALEETREKVTRPTCMLRSYAVVRGQDGRPECLLTLLHQIPQLVIDNAKMRDILDDPFSFRV